MAVRAERITRERTPTEFKGKAYTTAYEDDLELAVLRYASEWRSDWHLGSRRPNEIEVFLRLADDQLVTLVVRGEKTIDAVLDGDSGPLRDQLIRLGLPPAALIPLADGGPLDSVALSTSRFFPLKVVEYEERRDLLGQGVAFRDLPDRLRRRAKRVNFEYYVGEERFVSKAQAKAAAKKAGLEIETIDYRNRPAIESFLATDLGKELRPIPVSRVAPGKTVRQQADAAVQEARRRNRPVRLQVEVEGVPILVSPPEGRVGRVRRPSGALVQVVRGAGGRFAPAFDAATRAAIYREAKERTFSEVARELGIARGTIYGWGPK